MGAKFSASGMFGVIVGVCVAGALVFLFLGWAWYTWGPIMAIIAVSCSSISSPTWSTAGARPSTSTDARPLDPGERPTVQAASSRES